ncbi:MAG TPA: ABC transporter [Sphingomicrobium sp.]|nr:ABC transporter [Sphingomicrobium sp.]
MKMPRTAPIVLAVAAPLLLGACSLGGMLGGGGKPPTTLVTLTAEAAESDQAVRSAAVGQTVTIATPITGQELSVARVPVQVTPTDIQYVADLQLVDSPARLFQHLLEETIRRTTGKVVLSSEQSTLDPGSTITGVLQRFGYDASTGQVVIQYDASMAGPGSQIESRRFTASAPADGSAATVAPALNRAANQIALDVAKWVGG